MAKVLHIKANPKPDNQSKTFQLANQLIDEYKQHNPNDEIVEFDLYQEQIKFLDGDMLHKMFSGQDNEMKQHAQRFAEFDKYIVSAPMWNLGSPAILKAYFDYVAYVGITFKYTEQGPVGLLADKPRKVIHVVTRGGAYEGMAQAFEMGDKYIRTIFNFFGVTNIQTLKLEMTNVLMGEELEKATQVAYFEAKELAQQF